MMSPPSSTKLKSARPLEDFEAVHMPEFSDTRTRCVVCYKQGGHELKVQSFCSAPQCMRYMHVTKEKNCFKEYHSREYQNSYFFFLLLFHCYSYYIFSMLLLLQYLHGVF